MCIIIEVKPLTHFTIMKDNEDLVVLGEYENTIEANMIKGVLETNGIQAMLTNEIMSNILSLAPINYGW